jgi:hypothetical protein
LKIVTLEKYVPCAKNIEFATFFILNAKELETMRLKFCNPPLFTEETYKRQQEVLQWKNRASRRADLKLSTYCYHMHLDLIMHIWDRQSTKLDLPDPFTCEC